MCALCQCYIPISPNSEAKEGPKAEEKEEEEEEREDGFVVPVATVREV